LAHERSINLGMALERSTNHTYTSALNSYLTFCDLHHFPIDPTPNTLSYYVTSMATYVNPRSVDNYLSDICSLLEQYYPSVCDVSSVVSVPVQRKLSLTRADLARIADSFVNPSHDCLLFMAQLLNGFHGLLRLGELVWPDNTKHQLRHKLSLRTSVSSDPTKHSFVLQTHKTDRQRHFSCAGVPASEVQVIGRWSSDSFRIYVRKNPTLLHALILIVGPHMMGGILSRLSPLNL
ncbi:hypothetical protein BDR03DRAFT_848180, partial [Suillus americanus]